MKKKYLILFIMLFYLINCKDNNLPTVEEKPYLKYLGDNIFLHQSDMATEYIVPSGELDFWNNDKGDIAKLTATVCKKFNNDFDFVFIILNNSQTPSATKYAGLFTPINNNVMGTGGGFYSYSKSYGSGDRLKGTITFPVNTFIKDGPTLHELTHHCGAYIVSTYALDNNGKQINHYDHWGYSDAGGQLGGFRPEFITLNLDGFSNKFQAGFKGKEEGFGITANGRNSVPYSKIELYLWGLIPKNEVPPLKVYSGLSLLPNEKRKGVFFADNVKTYTVNDIVALNGERIPSVNNSQKEFRVLTVIVSVNPVSESEWKIVNNDLEWLSKKGDDGDINLFNFWEATGGRATIKTDGLKNSLK